MSADAKIVLELLIKRLEQWSDPKFAGGHWVGDEKGEAETQNRLKAGFVHFHQAVGTARAALASEDPELMEIAAYHCQALEREGLKLAIPHTAVTARRRYGGKQRGAQVKEKSEKGWAPYEEEFRTSSAGKDHAGQLRVRRRIVARMAKKGFLDPLSGEFPTRKTIAKHFAVKKRMGS